MMLKILNEKKKIDLKEQLIFGKNIELHYLEH
jgi:hypothetical protein